MQLDATTIGLMTRVFDAGFAGGIEYRGNTYTATAHHLRTREVWIVHAPDAYTAFSEVARKIGISVYEG